MVHPKRSCFMDGLGGVAEAGEKIKRSRIEVSGTPAEGETPLKALTNIIVPLRY